MERRLTMSAVATATIERSIAIAAAAVVAAVVVTATQEALAGAPPVGVNHWSDS
jgi:hypothetical protein